MSRNVVRPARSGAAPGSGQIRLPHFRFSSCGPWSTALKNRPQRPVLAFATDEQVELTGIAEQYFWGANGFLRCFPGLAPKVSVLLGKPAPPIRRMAFLAGNGQQVLHSSATVALGNFGPLNPAHIPTHFGPVRHTEFELVETADELVVVSPEDPRCDDERLPRVVVLGTPEELKKVRARPEPEFRDITLAELQNAHERKGMALANGPRLLRRPEGMTPHLARAGPGN